MVAIVNWKGRTQYDSHANMARWKGMRRRYLTGVYLVLCSTCVTLLLILCVTALSTEDSSLNDRWPRGSLTLLSSTLPHDNATTNDSGTDGPVCVPPSIVNFPNGVFTDIQRRNGAVIVSLLVALYMFGALAIVCDTYFMPSIEIICDALHLSEDVAGATFMAIGGSAPELFISVIGVFIAKGDIGIGTVVGSAVFNILFVIGLCGLVSGRVINLSCYPFTRDTACYIVCIVALVYVVFDDSVNWLDSVILLGLYTAYLIMMRFNPTIERFVSSNITTCGLERRDLSRNTSPQTEILGNSSELELLMRNEEDADEEINSNGDVKVSRNCKSNLNSTDIETNEETLTENSDDIKSPIEVPDGFLSRCLWFGSLPIAVAFYVTIPDCRKEKWHRCYSLTFCLALLWIAMLTYTLVWMVTVIGATLEIPDTIMGLTLLALGASIPDTILSIIAAREGYGDMAISHAIGSNLFDILVGLGLPWFIQTVIVNSKTTVFIYSGAVVYIAILLLGNISLTYVLLRLNRFILDKKLGCVLLLFYAGFLIFSILFETNSIVPSLTLPECLM